MPAYRFCRPDDIPLLVAAVNECYGVHFPGWDPLTVDGFRDAMKEIDVWPSNSMVALAGEDPIAVLIGTKRSTEVLILRVGVRADHQRQGHALHILTSLSQKLAVLGPERLVTEVPLDNAAAVALVEAAGYEVELRFTDRVRPAGPAEPVPEELVVPSTLDELDDAGLLDVPSASPWERDARSLRQRTGLRALALGTPMGLEAGLVWRQEDGGRVEIAAVPARGGQAALFQELLLRHLANTAVTESAGDVLWPKVFPGEVGDGVLERLGFRADRHWARYARTASPA